MGINKGYYFVSLIMGTTGLERYEAIQWAFVDLSKKALYETVFLIVADEKLKKSYRSARKSSCQPHNLSFIIKNQ
jgi:hypothetical protein